MSTMEVLHVSVRCQNYKTNGKFLIILRQPQQLWKIDRIVERIEQALEKGKIEGSTMDSRTKKRDESEDDPEGEKP